MTTFAIGGDLKVRRIGFGAMRLTENSHGPTAGIWRSPLNWEGAAGVLRDAVELGVNFIDTSDAYALGGNEELIARALHPYDDVVIATKVGLTRPSPQEWVPVGRPEYLRQQVELSLRRLRVDQIDLLYLHRIDPLVPLADQVGALAGLREEGKIRHIGLSEVSLPQLRVAGQVAPIAAVQNVYNLATWQHEDVLDHTAEHGIAFVPYFPIAMGEHVDVQTSIADELGATPSQVALAWLLRRSPTVVPIPGTTNVDHLRENLGALDVELSVDQFNRLAAA